MAGTACQQSFRSSGFSSESTIVVTMSPSLVADRIFLNQRLAGGAILHHNFVTRTVQRVQSVFSFRLRSAALVLFPSTVFAALGSLETLPSQCDRHADFELERLLRLTFCEVIGALEAAAAQLQINSTSRFESFALRCINVYSGSGILPSDTASQISMRSSSEWG